MSKNQHLDITRLSSETVSSLKSMNSDLQGLLKGSSQITSVDKTTRNRKGGAGIIVDSSLFDDDTSTQPARRSSIHAKHISEASLAAAPSRIVPTPVSVYIESNSKSATKTVASSTTVVTTSQTQDSAPSTKKSKSSKNIIQNQEIKIVARRSTRNIKSDSPQTLPRTRSSSRSRATKEDTAEKRAPTRSSSRSRATKEDIPMTRTRSSSRAHATKEEPVRTRSTSRSRGTKEEPKSRTRSSSRSRAPKDEPVPKTRTRSSSRSRATKEESTQKQATRSRSSSRSRATKEEPGQKRATRSRSSSRSRATKEEPVQKQATRSRSSSRSRPTKEEPIQKSTSRSRSSSRTRATKEDNTDKLASKSSRSRAMKEEEVPEKRSSRSRSSSRVRMTDEEPKSTTTRSSRSRTTIIPEVTSKKTALKSTRSASKPVLKHTAVESESEEEPIVVPKSRRSISQSPSRQTRKSAAIIEASPNSKRSPSRTRKSEIVSGILKQDIHYTDSNKAEINKQLRERLLDQPKDIPVATRTVSTRSKSGKRSVIQKSNSTKIAAPQDHAVKEPTKSTTSKSSTTSSNKPHVSRRINIDQQDTHYLFPYYNSPDNHVLKPRKRIAISDSESESSDYTPKRQKLSSDSMNNETPTSDTNSRMTVVAKSALVTTPLLAAASFMTAYHYLGHVPSFNEFIELSLALGKASSDTVIQFAQQALQRF